MTIKFGDFIDDTEELDKKVAAPPPDHGSLAKWLDNRFFGFVEPDGGGSLFIHGSAFREAGVAPVAGMRLQFTTTVAADGRQRVARVWPEDEAAR